MKLKLDMNNLDKNMRQVFLDFSKIKIKLLKEYTEVMKFK